MKSTAIVKKRRFWTAAASALCALVLAAALPFTALTASAAAGIDSTQRITIDVELHQDGSGVVTETRTVSLYKGSENYISMKNLGQTQLLDFKVSENGTPYQRVEPWDLMSSKTTAEKLAGKAGKYGVNRVAGGFELCWGIGSYGTHTYVVQYTLSNMVKQLQDGQSFFWQLYTYGSNIPPKDLQIRIQGFGMPYSVENAQIFGYGMPANINFAGDGTIVAASTRALTSSEHATVLIQFPKSPFTLSEKLEMTLAQQKQKADVGATVPTSQTASSGGLSSRTISGLIRIGIFGFVILMSTLMGVLRGTKGAGVSSLPNFAPDRSKSKIQSENKDQYYRDIPYTQGPLSDMAPVFAQMGEGTMEQYISAYLLKWLYEGRVESVKTEEGFIFKRETSSIRFLTENIESGDASEQALWLFMRSAAGEDGVLERNEFTTWTGKSGNFNRLTSWNTNRILYGTKAMKQHGYFTEETRKVLFFNRTVDVNTPEGVRLVDNTQRFKNFLENFSLLNERGAADVALWDKLLIWAAVLGIADKVREQFKSLYPQYETESTYHSNDILLMHSFSHGMSQSYSSAVSSGSGGGFSMGGGGGSFGGGGGGGSR